MQTNNPLDGSRSGALTIGFRFVPESHIPLQQPRVSVLLSSQEGLFGVVRYSFASPSLTGSYVLCSIMDEPLLCGGRISLTITGENSLKEYSLILSFFVLQYLLYQSQLICWYPSMSMVQ